MNTQLERLFHSLRRGVEGSVKSALKNIDLPSQKDIHHLRTRIDELRSGDLRVLKKKLDEVRTTLGRIEAIKPYLSAVEAAGKAYRAKSSVKKRRTPKKKPAAKKRARSRVMKTA